MSRYEVIKVLIDNEEGLSDDERSKLIAGYDEIYLNSRIEHHQRMARKQSMGLILILFFCILTFGIMMFSSLADEHTLGWLKGIATGYFFALLVLFPKTTRNHSRIEYLLRTIKQLYSGFNA